MMKPEDVYSEEYLRFYRRESNMGIVVDPSNQFNHDQHLAAVDVFGQLTGGDTSPFDNLGLDFLTKAHRGDAFSVRLLENDAWSAVRVRMPSLAVEPSVWLATQWLQNMVLDVDATMELLHATGARHIDVLVKDPAGQPVADAKVAAIYDVTRKIGAEVRTTADGRARLTVPSSWERIEAFSVQPRHSFWSYAVRDWTPPQEAVAITLKALQTALPSPIYSYVRSSLPTDGAGVRVAVIDAGVGPHRDLVVNGGANVSNPEEPGYENSYEDNGTGHGTHVAGIIAGRGIVNPLFVGLAPAASLYSYRVCAQGSREAQDFAIAQAIEEALADQCDLINISMGHRTQSSLISRRVRQALASGTAIIAAAGNGARSQVTYPAATPGVIAVSAIGRHGTVPPDTMSFLAMGTPTGEDPKDCIAAFTNKGIELWATGPGVGIVSCHPGDRYSAEDGTSMAAPVVTGLTARALGSRQDVLRMDRKQDRADEIRKLAVAAARMLGFDPVYVGRGLPS